MTLLRRALLTMLMAVLLSCGGGSGGGGAPLGVVGPATTGSNSGTAATGTGAPAVTSGAAGDAAAAAPASSGTAAGTGSQGLGGIASSPDASTATAAGGDDGSGVGSGGTGISTADATGVGAVDGAGSIIVNGLRYSTDSTIAHIEDAAAGLQLGMSVKVTGPVDASFTNGIARLVESAADLRGPLNSVDVKHGSLVVLGTTVTTDDATVWADASGIAALTPGRTLQVWGLPGAPGVMRATRVEQRDASMLILTGTVQDLDVASRTFTLGSLVVDYGSATLSGSLDGRPLANGTLVRVRAAAGPAGLAATVVQWWYPVPAADGTTAQIAGIVTGYAGIGSFRILGVPVDASSAQVTGGPVASIGNGVKLEIGGVMSRGILRATKLKIRNVPGTGGPASFNLIGTVGAFNSPADFRVRGQPVNASGPGVVFTNGTASSLGNGVKVNIHGAAVVNGVLLATDVLFQ